MQHRRPCRAHRALAGRAFGALALRSFDAAARLACFALERCHTAYALAGALVLLVSGAAGAAEERASDRTVTEASPTRALTELAARARSRLLERAVRAERAPNERAPWDEAVSLALAARARVELLRAGVPGSLRERIWRHALDAGELALAYEARGTLGRLHCPAACQRGRGWGTSRGLKLGPLHAERALDAYSTGTVLGALAEVATYAAEHDERDVAARLWRSVSPVLDDWLEHHRFVTPDGAPSFDKLLVADPAVRRYVVFNTDALLGRALLVWSELGRRLGDTARADRQRRVAAAVALRLSADVVEPVGRAPLADAGEAWRYGRELLPGGGARALRIEDANHASFVLDFVARAAESGLADDRGAPLFERRQLTALGRLLPTLYPRAQDGSPRFEVDVDPSQRVTGARGKQRALERSAPRRSQGRAEVATWRRELGGARRTLDLGLSIRTAWGWAQAVADETPRLVELGRYLEAADRGEHAGSRNLLLARAVWLRVAERRLRWLAAVR